MRTLRPMSLLILFQRNVVVSRTCYWPDESIVSDQEGDNYTPCNSTANGVDSACCDKDDVCSSSGYCLGRSGYMYRGACTDPSWNAEACSQECKDTAIDTYSNIIPCPAIEGTFAQNFCCERTRPDYNSCCNVSLFTLGLVESLFKPEAGINGSTSASPALATRSSSSVISSSISTSSTSASLPPISTSISVSSTLTSALPILATPSSKQSSPSKKPVDIGVGVGVPLVVLMVLGLALFLIYEHRLRIKAEKTIVDTVAAQNMSYLGWEREQTHQWRDHPGPLELGNTQRQPAELYDGEVHEAGGTL